MNLDGASGLYLLNLCVDKVILVNPADEKRNSVCLQAFFWGLPMINIYRSQTRNEYDDGADPNVFINFELGTTGYFHSATLDLIRSIQRHPIVVTVYQNLEGTNCFEPVGTCRVKVTERFSEVICRAATCAVKHAVSGIIKGVYNVVDREHIQVGTVSLSVQLVCYDNSLLKTPYVSPNQSNAVGSVEHSKYLLPKETSDGFVLVPAEGPGDVFVDPFPINQEFPNGLQRNATWPEIPINGATAALSPIDITNLVCETTMSERFFNADQSNDSFISQKRNEVSDGYTVEHPPGKRPETHDEADARKMTIETYLSDSGTDTKKRAGESGKLNDSANRLQEHHQNLMPVQLYCKNGSVECSRNSSLPTSPAQERSQQPVDSRSLVGTAKTQPPTADRMKEDQNQNSGKKSTSELILSAFAPRLKKQVDCDPFNYEYSKASQHICKKYLSRRQEKARSTKPFEKQSSQYQESEMSFEQMETTASPIPSQYSGNVPAEEGARLSDNTASKQAVQYEQNYTSNDKQQGVSRPKESVGPSDRFSDDAARQPQKYSSSEKSVPQPSQRQQLFIRQNCVQIDSLEKLNSRCAQDRTATKSTQSEICLEGRYVGRQCQPYLPVDKMASNQSNVREVADTPHQSGPEGATTYRQPNQTSSKQHQSYNEAEPEEIRSDNDLTAQEFDEDMENKSLSPNTQEPVSELPAETQNDVFQHPFPGKVTSIASFQVRDICKCCVRNHDPPPYRPAENTSSKIGLPQISSPLQISPGEDTAGMRTSAGTSSVGQVEAVNTDESYRQISPQRLSQYPSRRSLCENIEVLEECKFTGRAYPQQNNPASNYSQTKNIIAGKPYKQREPENDIVGLYSSPRSTTNALNVDMKSGQKVEQISPYKRQGFPIEVTGRDTIVCSCHNYDMAGRSCGFCAEINPEPQRSTSGRPEIQPDTSGFINGEWSTPGNERFRPELDGNTEKRQQVLLFHDEASNKKKTSWSFFQNDSCKDGSTNRIQTAAEKVLLLCGCPRHIQHPPGASDEVDPEYNTFSRNTGVKPQAVCLLHADCPIGMESLTRSPVPAPRSPVPAPRSSYIALKPGEERSTANYQLTSGEDLLGEQDYPHLASSLRTSENDFSRAENDLQKDIRTKGNPLCGGYQQFPTDSRWKHHGKPRSRGGQTDARHSHARRIAKQATQQEKYQQDKAEICDSPAMKPEGHYSDYRNMDSISGKPSHSSYMSVHPSNDLQHTVSPTERQLRHEVASCESKSDPLEQANNSHVCDGFLNSERTAKGTRGWSNYLDRICPGYANSAYADPVSKLALNETAFCKNPQEHCPRFSVHLGNPRECRGYNQKNPNVLITPVDSPGTFMSHSNPFRWGEIQSLGPHSGDRGGSAEKGCPRSGPDTEPKETLKMTCLPRPATTSTCNASSVSKTREEQQKSGYIPVHYSPRPHCHSFRDLNLSGYGGYDGQMILKACAADSCASSVCLLETCFRYFISQNRALA